MKAKIKAKSNINISDIFLPWVKKIKYANTPSGLGGVWRFLSILGGLILLGFVLLLTYRGHSPNQSMTSTYLLKQTRTSVGALGQTESNGVDLKDGQGLDHLGGDLYPKDSDLINFQSSNKTGMDSRSNQELTTRRNAPTEIYTANSNDNNGGNLAGTTSISVTHAVPLAHPEETVAEAIKRALIVYPNMFKK